MFVCVVQYVYSCCFVGSKNNHGPNATSGYVGGKTNQITCYHNGKLATPQSLIPKKSSSHATKVNKKSDQVAIPQAIDEDVATGLKKISSSQDGAKSANSLSMKSSNSR